MPDSVLDRLHALIARLDELQARLDARSRAFSRARLTIVLLGSLAALVVGGTIGAGTGWLTALGTVLFFLALARLHDRVERALSRLRHWQAVQTRHVARLTLDWEALPNPPPRAPSDHPFGGDLDLTGPRSILHLLDATTTVGAHDRLRSWLLTETPDPDGARTRQQRAQALVPRRRLRDRLTLAGLEATGSGMRWDDHSILDWLNTPVPSANFRRWALILGSLALLNHVLLVVDVTGGPPLWRYSLFAYLALYLVKYASFRDVFDRAYALQRALGHVASALRMLEAQHIPAGSPLAPVWTAFQSAERPSEHFGRLHRIAAVASYTNNDIGKIVLNVLMPYDLLLALALDRLRTDLVDVAPRWLDALYEIEALASLAAYADFRSEHVTFPDLLDPSEDAPLFEAAALGHPLLPADEAVRNDATLNQGEGVIVTGSNMSGKSTYLRSVGVATVLAWAGGAVDAEVLRIQPLRTFTSMRVADVLQEGFSTFYAEVRRLRALLDAVEVEEAAPVLVLVDEMFRGTNNRERLAGAEAMVRTLRGANATSLIATHDLSLTAIADEAPGVRNIHFREEAEGGRLTFDYRLREGPCPTTNALIIMRRAGLPVPENGPERALSETAVRRTSTG